RCRCQCGVERAVRSDHLKSGRSQSCGCAQATRTPPSVAVAIRNVAAPALPMSGTGDQDVLPAWTPSSLMTPSGPQPGRDGWRYSPQLNAVIRTVWPPAADDWPAAKIEFDPFY